MRSRRFWKLAAALLLSAGLLCLAADAGAGKDEAESARVLTVEVTPSHDRQVIDGFGGSLAFRGFDAPEEALRYAFDDLGATLVRVPGEVSPSGMPDECRAALRRVTRLDPRARGDTAWRRSTSPIESTGVRRCRLRVP